MSEIIIGVDGTERGEDVVAFGRRVAAFARARIVLADAFPYEEMRGFATSVAYGLHAATRALASTSPARTLHEVAERDRAALIVVGSSHVGRARRVLPGSAGERLPHGSPCAVAVVPNDYRESEHTAHA